MPKIDEKSHLATRPLNEILAALVAIRCAKFKGDAGLIAKNLNISDRILMEAMNHWSFHYILEQID
ncbi:hypothetical protein HY637_06240 [Candidatus Woesearchaeota archaeon]|nr:hypothetical protein [Candidatus Woesearchaeota archaeon]